jgi:hypothetical protein
MNSTIQPDLPQELKIDSMKLPWDKPAMKMSIIFSAALSTGIAWRMRGDGIYGGSQGVFMVGAILFSFMMIVFAEWRRWTPALLGIMALLFASGSGGWGTFIRQLAGAFWYYDADGVYQIIPVSHVGGYFWLFFVGMGWMPLMGFIIAVFFSQKKYTLRDLGVAILVAIICHLFGSLVLGHLVAPLISPEAVGVFSDAVAPSSPWEYYLSNYNPLAEDHLVDIPAGRNYHSMISNFASALETIGVWAYFRFLKKDYRSARISFSIALIMGISMAAMGFWVTWGLGCNYPNATCDFPEKIAKEYWSLWEFFTGFCFGGFFMWYLVSLPQQAYLNSKDVPQSLLPEKYTSKANTLFVILMIVIASPLLALNDGINRIENGPNSILIVGIIGVCMLLLYVISRKTWLPKFWAERPLSIRKIGWIIFSYSLGIAALLVVLLPPPMDFTNLRYTDSFIIYGTPAVLALTTLITFYLERAEKSLPN